METTTRRVRPLSVRAVSRRVDVAPSTVRRWISDGLTAPSGRRVFLEARRVGARYRVEVEDLDLFLARVEAA